MARTRLGSADMTLLCTVVWKGSGMFEVLRNMKHGLQSFLCA